MPHAWRFAARSNASPSTCRTPDGIGPVRSVVSALADRTAIDWTALFWRARDAETQRLLHALQDVERIRRTHASGDPWEPPRIRLRALACLLALAVLQIVPALSAAAGDPGAMYAAGLLSHLLLACSFVGASLVLAFAAGRDPRAVFLLAFFTFSAAAFTRAILTALGPNVPRVVVEGVFPEAFAPAALWHFAVLFPSVLRFTRFDVLARRIAGIVWALATVLFLSNVLSAYGAGGPAVAWLGRDDPRNLFWHLFVLVSLPAVFAIPIRALRAPRAEQVKVRRFAGAIAAGSLPFLCLGMARMLLPDVNRWLLAAGGPGRTAVDAIVIAGLVGMPLLSAAAVLADGAIPRPRSGPIGRFLSRFSLSLIGVSPGPGAQRRRLRGALERVRLARGPREIRDVLRRELQFALGASVVRIVAPRTLPRGSALRAIVAAHAGPIELRRDGEPFLLLPAGDRDWLVERNIDLIAAIHSHDDVLRSAVLAGFRPQRALSRADLWFISMLVTAAAAAWDAHARARSTRGARDDAAFECVACGRVRAGRASCCGREPALAALPAALNGKFSVSERLGAGGMGVVYLAEDVALGRRVALKTLPSLHPGRVGRLRREARTMAALNHPALATIYGVEIWRGTPVHVLEHFPLGTLKDRLRSEGMPVAELLSLGIGLSDALAYMHDRHVLHRDVKPSNIGFTSDGVAKIFDLGLSFDVVACGTPGYLSPEALAGHPPDAAMDLWALATVLREACATRIASNQALKAFFARALAVEPEDRFPTARDMRTALESLRVG